MFFLSIPALTFSIFPPVLTNLGEKMTDDEVDELLKAVDTSSGEINYTGMFTLPGFGSDGNVATC